MTTAGTRARDINPLGAFDDPRFAGMAVKHAETYRTADPYPHIVLDNFLDEDLADALAAAFPAGDSIDWVKRDNENNRRRYQHDETKVPSLLRQMLREFNSRQFVLFLETLTGIDNLLPDPYFIGGGVHMSGRGDFLKVHADFNWHHKLQAHRRVNALLYLNRGWKEEWAGAVEFWNKEMTAAVDSALPTFNRLVVFSTTEDSNHGQPRPNDCPPDEFRKVLNLYYYTTHRDASEMEAPHFTLYKTDNSPFAVQLGADYRNTGTPQDQQKPAVHQGA